MGKITKPLWKIFFIISELKAVTTAQLMDKMWNSLRNAVGAAGRQEPRDTNPWESDEGAAAEADVRRSFLLPGEDRGRAPKEEAGNSAGRSFLPQTRWAASEAEPTLTWSDGAARRRDRWWPATAPPQRMVATAAICVYREDVSVRMLCGGGARARR